MGDSGSVDCTLKLQYTEGSYVTSFFPKGYTLHNYVRLFTDTQVLDFPQMFKNTFIIAVFSCLISTIFVLSVSYCMSRMRFKIRKTYMNIAMILGLFPAFMSMVAVYYILKAVGLSEGSMIRVALILVYSGGSGAGFLLAKGFLIRFRRHWMRRLIWMEQRDSRYLRR